MDSAQPLDVLIQLALAEDRVDDDVTTRSLAEFDSPARAVVTAKAPGVISGCGAFVAVMAAIDPQVRVEILRGDGTRVAPGDPVLSVYGRESSILRGERTALNFLGRLSGVATRTALYCERLAGTRTRLLDTRKTTPGFRELEKKAVRDGGGDNHRHHLADLAMIKDNHIEMAGSIGAAVAAVRRHVPGGTPIEVEVKNLAELHEALDLGVSWIMLDNFSTESARQAVALVAGRARTEISGNVTLENLAEKARTGVDVISVGAITHSAPVLDLSLTIERIP